MGFPKDLDEHTEDTLLEELARRRKLNSEGKCDYCEKPLNNQPACRMEHRHNKTAYIVKLRALMSATAEVAVAAAGGTLEASNKATDLAAAGAVDWVYHSIRGRNVEVSEVTRVPSQPEEKTRNKR